MVQNSIKLIKNNNSHEMSGYVAQAWREKWRV